MQKKQLVMHQTQLVMCLRQHEQETWIPGDFDEQHDELFESSNNIAVGAVRYFCSSQAAVGTLVTEDCLHQNYMKLWNLQVLSVVPYCEQSDKVFRRFLLSDTPKDGTHGYL